MWLHVINVAPNKHKIPEFPKGALVTASHKKYQYRSCFGAEILIFALGYGTRGLSHKNAYNQVFKCCKGRKN